MTVTSTPARPTFSLLEREYYTSEEVFAREFDLLFSKEWIYAGHVSQLPAKGSFLKIPYGGEEIVVVRGPAQEFYAHLNVCRHRGFRICGEDSGKVRAFVCPYHQWRYNLDGALHSVPQMQDGEYFDYADYGLRIATVEQWNGMLFVNLNESPVMPVAEQLRSHADVVAKYAPENTKLVHEERYLVAGNWKLAAENALECYHCTGSHATLCKVVDVAALQHDLTQWIDSADNADYSDHGMRIQPGMQTLSADGTLITDKLLGSCGPDDVANGESGGVTLMPNLFFGGFYVDHWWALSFRPLSPRQTEINYAWFVRSDVDEEHLDVDKLIQVGHVTQSEDNALIERTQAGVDSRCYTPGPVGSDVERALHDFVASYRLRMQ